MKILCTWSFLLCKKPDWFKTIKTLFEISILLSCCSISKATKSRFPGFKKLQIKLSPPKIEIKNDVKIINGIATQKMKDFSSNRKLLKFKIEIIIEIETEIQNEIKSKLSIKMTLNKYSKLCIKLKPHKIEN